MHHVKMEKALSQDNNVVPALKELGQPEDNRANLVRLDSVVESGQWNVSHVDMDQFHWREAFVSSDVLLDKFGRICSSNARFVQKERSRVQETGHARNAQ